METTDLAYFHQMWGRFAAWLAAHSPHDHAELRAPATERQIADLEDLYGFPLHPELKALLLLHDGVRKPQPGHDLDHFRAGGFLPLGHRLIGTEAMAGHHGILTTFCEDFPENWGEDWDEDEIVAHAHQWVVFAEPNDGGMAFVDHRPGPTYGHVYEFGMGSGASEATLWATGLGELFERLSESLERETKFKDRLPYLEELDPGRVLLEWR